jgi:hypothetical protein
MLQWLCDVDVGVASLQPQWLQDATALGGDVNGLKVAVKAGEIVEDDREDDPNGVDDGQVGPEADGCQNYTIFVGVLHQGREELVANTFVESFDTNNTLVARTFV